MEQVKITKRMRKANDLKEKLFNDYLLQNKDISRKDLNKALTKFINDLNVKEYENQTLIYTAITNLIKSFDRFPDYEIEGILQFTSSLISNRIINNAIESESDVLRKEAVKFLSTKNPREYNDDVGRYFYNKDDFSKFVKMYKLKINDLKLSNLHIGLVPDDNLCIEVTHKIVWDKHRELCWATKDYLIKGDGI